MTNIQPNEETEIRASLCWWFASLLSKELDDQQLHELQNGDGALLLRQLAEAETLAPSVARLQQALAGFNALQHPRLELAADFSQLFLGDAKTGAPPYASLYLSDKGMLFQEPHERMQKLLASQGLEVQKEFNEPADHVAIQLDYLGNLILRQGDHQAEQQAEFIEQHLLNWIPLWQQASARITNSGFYQAVISLLLGYLQLELEALSAA